MCKTVFQYLTQLSESKSALELTVNSCKETSKWNTVILRMTLNFPSAVDFEDQSKCDYRLIESFRIIQNDTKSFRLIFNPRQFKFTRIATDTSPFLITSPLHVFKADVFLVGHRTTNTVPERLNRGRLHRNSFLSITSTNDNRSLFVWLVLPGKLIATRS